jgi:radical SAM protein with 4Fe4S-binding SPASM domain
VKRFLGSGDLRARPGDAKVEIPRAEAPEAVPPKRNEPITLLCGQPFSQIYIERTGVVRPCCIGSHNLGNLMEQSVEEIWNGPAYQELRRQMLEGIVPEPCAKCVRLGRVLPFRYEEGLDLARPERLVFLDEQEEGAAGEDATDPAPAPPRPEPQPEPQPEPEPAFREEDHLTFDLEGARITGSTRETMQLCGSFGWDHDEHLEAVISFEGILPDRETKVAIFPPLRVDFPPKLELSRSVEFEHGLGEGLELHAVRLSVACARTGRRLIEREVRISGAGERSPVR